VNHIEPGDLTMPQILAVFDALTRIRAAALEGLSDVETAQSLEWRVHDVRAGAALLGFRFHPLIRRQELCPVCGHILMPDGHCEVCALNKRLERLIAVNEAEHRREVERLEREIDAVKQDTCRVRDRLGTNPRKNR
jgi:hypothetical protein